jgi:hypothetical protein
VTGPMPASITRPRRTSTIADRRKRSSSVKHCPLQESVQPDGAGRGSGWIPLEPLLGDPRERIHQRPRGPRLELLMRRLPPGLEETHRLTEKGASVDRRHAFGSTERPPTAVNAARSLRR